MMGEVKVKRIRRHAHLIYNRSKGRGEIGYEKERKDKNTNHSPQTKTKIGTGITSSDPSESRQSPY
jgi:hypothetical protein